MGGRFGKRPSLALRCLWHSDAGPLRAVIRVPSRAAARKRFAFDFRPRAEWSKDLQLMKKLYLAAFVLVLGIGLRLEAAEPENPEFPGLEKAMTPGDYEAAGLQKLDPAERAKLDEFIRNYVAVSNERVATTAVDKAVKENKVSAPEVIQSRIVGPFTGYNGRTRFKLENGQVWAQGQAVSAYYPKIDSPHVVIVKAGFGYRMYIAGGGNIRVSLIR